MHTACETGICYAQAVANGAGVWYGIHGPTSRMNTPGGKKAVEFNKFMSEHKDHHINTTSTGNIGPMWSQDTANNYSSSISETDFTSGNTTANELKGYHYKSFYGFYEILMRGHEQFDIIDDTTIKSGDLKKYELLILPTCACMSIDTAS